MSTHFNYIMKEILPLQKVSVPLQDPLERQRLTDEPFKLNPSSQLNIASFGKVVSRPKCEPFKGTGSWPQSLAKGSKR